MRRGLFKNLPENYAVKIQPFLRELRCWDYLQFIVMLLLLGAGVLFI